MLLVLNNCILCSICSRDRQIKQKRHQGGKDLDPNLSTIIYQLSVILSKFPDFFKPLFYCLQNGQECYEYVLNIKIACTVPDCTSTKYAKREPAPLNLLSMSSFTLLVRVLQQNKVNFSLLDLQVSIEHKGTFYGALEYFSSTINIFCQGHQYLKQMALVIGWLETMTLKLVP